MKNILLQTKRVALIAFVIVFCNLAWAGDGSVNYYFATPGALAEVKARLAAGDKSLQPALKNLVKEADKALEVLPPSVVEKTKTPPSGDKHDYMSIATYFWPDPKNPSGPYIRHDGKVNPETRNDAYDYNRVTTLGGTVETLALAYYFTGKEIYAEHAAKFLRVWFLNPATRMNPNMNFTQAVIGENTGRGTGVIEGRNLSQAADAAQLLAGSPAWTEKDRAELKAWLEKYFDWLTTSKNGLDEAGSKNNHGTWYDVQAIELALVLGKMDAAKQIAETAKQKRVAVQIEADGKQPLELSRTAALGYSHFNLEALFTLATMSEYAGVDLWRCQLANGKYALATALDFLLPYAADSSKKWPYKQIKEFNRAEFAPQLRHAVVIYHDPKYEKVLGHFEEASRGRFHLLQPVSVKSEASAPLKKELDIAVIDRERILHAADSALSLEPITITSFPAKSSEGGRNDYFSMADYYWPDPTKTNGLPFIVRDGESYPGVFTAHRMAMRNLRDAVAALGAAYKITGAGRYATKSAELLQRFFLDPATRMNPNLEYAQAILGKSPGRSYGIIDTLHMIEIPAAVTAMENSPSFTPELVAGLKQWFREYSDWMVKSKNGMEEAKAKNNHAVAFWLQVACFAKFTGDEAKLAECRRQFKEVFVPNQMAADGGFPLELKRTKPYAYSIFQLDNMTTLCQVLSTSKENLWNFQLPDGRSIRKAVAYLYPFLADKSKWPLKPDVMAWDGWPSRQVNLLFAGLVFGEPKYLELWKKLQPDPTDLEVRRNIAITQPILWVKDSVSGNDHDVSAAVAH
jgi:Alginate lyase